MAYFECPKDNPIFDLTTANLSLYSEDCRYEHLSAKGQVTWCKSCQYSGYTFVCSIPSISYGSTFGGVPTTASDLSPKYDNTITLQWCKELGFVGTGTVITSPDDLIDGGVFWGKGFDDTNYKWCDVDDGFWKNTTLGVGVKNNLERIQQLTCSNGKFDLLSILLQKNTFIYYR